MNSVFDLSTARDGARFMVADLKKNRQNKKSKKFTAISFETCPEFNVPIPTGQRAPVTGLLFQLNLCYRSCKISRT